MTTVDLKHDQTIIWRDGEVLRRRAGSSHWVTRQSIPPLDPPAEAPPPEIDLADFL